MLPDVRLTIQKNGLGILPGSIVGVPVKLGIAYGGAINTLYSFGDANVAAATLYGGPLLEATADTLDKGGSPVLAIALNPSAQGSVGSAVHVGTGTATVTGTAAPAQQIDIKITTAGGLGTMAFSWRVGGGAYSAPIVSTVTSFSYVVAGTPITFASQTYTQGDVWSFLTDGTSSITGSGTLGWVTAASSPVDGYDLLVKITTAGALGAAQFTYSLDGGNTPSAQILVPSGGKYVVPGAGVCLTFSGTFVLGDTYELACAPAGFSTTDVNAAMTVLLANPATWGFVHIVGQGANAAAAASMAAAIDTKMSAAETAFRYAFAVVECPTSESDSTVATAFASFTSDRVMVCAGDIKHESSISGLQIRRNCATVITSRMSGIAPSIDPGNNSTDTLEALANVVALYRDEAKTTYLDAQRFATLRTFVGESGYFLTNGNLMTTDDFSLVQNRRVMDVACTTTRKILIPYLNRRVQVDKQTGLVSKLYASRIEKRAQKLLEAVLVTPGDATNVSIAIDRSANVLSTKTLPVTIGVQPNGYAKFIQVTIGFVNPALI